MTCGADPPCCRRCNGKCGEECPCELRATLTHVDCGGHCYLVPGSTYVFECEACGAIGAWFA